ncbi:MAG: hypothetical protein JEZ14_05860 [Marinilabiliaceae bacterium]|nr:hypothetical protein [Marinilabiliaceae bacterium]
MRLFNVLILLAFVFTLNAQNKWGHVIPEKKNLSADWIKSLTEKGERAVYRGEQLKTIGMPCGGIASGQLYVRGDGTLAGWWIANNAYNTGYGIDHLMNFETAQGPWKVCYQTFEPFSYIEQGFKIKVKSGNQRFEKQLNKDDFNNISFIGEYPLAQVTYEDSEFSLPVDVQMEVFSPFIPLNARESATPGTYLKFKLKNRSGKKVETTLQGHLQNMVMLDLKGKVSGKARNRAEQTDNCTSLYMDFVADDKKSEAHPYYGNMVLSVVDGMGQVITDIHAGDDKETTKQLGESLVGSVSSQIQLKPGEEKEILFLLSWFFPNRPKNNLDGGNWNKPIPTDGPAIGNMYANWFDSSSDVAHYLHNNYKRLSRETYQFHDTYYNQTTLPYWLIHRVMMPVSTLASETCQWWATDKFWAWEGVGSCVGTCTHVWNYEQALARLFPELERNIREKTDFETSFNKDGSIQARNGWGGVLIDGHAGAILKAYREHLVSKNHLFLSRNWSKIKKATEFIISEDENEDGLIEKGQSNTYDIAFFGANTYVGGLYLAALQAAEKMAMLMDDTEFAKKCQTIYKSGSELSSQKLWNGEYFFQDVDLEKHAKFQYANGCLSDQLFGQTWAHQLKLGYLYPEEKVKTALHSIWKYNWTKDVGPQNEKFIPERYYAHAGEPGLLNCSFPISKHLNEDAVRYRNEVWTGIEYQVATNMIYDGMITEGLSLVKGVHERYQPEKHNPWNEIECGDHYARALASWGVLIALEDYFYDGPQGKLSFSPQIQENQFEGFFAGAEAWGTIGQTRNKKGQTNTIDVKYGRLSLEKVQLEIPTTKKVEEVEIILDDKQLESNFSCVNNVVEVSFEKQQLKSDEKIVIKLKY